MKFSLLDQLKPTGDTLIFGIILNNSLFTINKELWEGMSEVVALA